MSEEIERLKKKLDDAVDTLHNILTGSIPRLPDKYKSVQPLFSAAWVRQMFDVHRRFKEWMKK
jgi:hypothetical protein